MKAKTFIPAAAAALALAVSGESATAQETTTATPQTHPVMLAYQFGQAKYGADVIGRYDYKTAADCAVGAQEAYNQYIEETGAKESELSGSYFCIDSQKGIVGSGFISKENVSRGYEIDTDKRFSAHKKLGVTHGFADAPLKFDPVR